MADRIIEIASTSVRNVSVDLNRVVEIDAPAKIIEATQNIQYSSNKITFVVGTTDGSPITLGDKQTYGTRINDGTITKWTIIADQPTTTEVRIQRATSFPSFVDILTINLAAADYATGSASIALNDMDVLNLVLISNSDAARITVELLIR